jgi:hypothetical protein
MIAAKYGHPDIVLTLINASANMHDGNNVICIFILAILTMILIVYF